MIRDSIQKDKKDSRLLPQTSFHPSYSINIQCNSLISKEETSGMQY